MTTKPARLCFVKLVLVNLLAVLSYGASASALDPALVDGSVFFNLSPPAGINFNTFGTVPLSGPGGFIQFVSGGEPSPFLSAEADISPGFSGRASGTLLYAMEVLGPAGDVPVSVAVAGGASGSSSSDLFTGFALKAQWRLEDVGLGLAEVFAEGINTPALKGIFNETFGHTVNLTLTAGHIYRVTLVADAFAGAVDSGTRTFASAFIDPVFTFGPGVGPEYSFHFSDGIGNSPIPLPGALFLMGSALAGLTRARCSAPHRSTRCSNLRICACVWRN